ncbi:MAG: UMP kinase [Armatimonadota bacterium]
MSDDLSGQPRWNRIVLKLSGELLGGPGGTVDWENVHRIGREVADIYEAGIELAIVVGGGNIWRGWQAAEHGMDRATADYAGMVATVINSLCLQDVLESENLETRVQTAIDMREVAEPFIRRRAIRHMEKGRVVIFAAGTGNPFFTTDTAAVLRAVEIAAQAIVKGTKVDGVYDKDPEKYPDARRYDHLEYEVVLRKRLKVMDSTAISLSMDNDLPILVFDITRPNNLRKALFDRGVGTLVSNTP